MQETKGQREIELRLKGLVIAGCDEVGRGCLAGPVHAAVVIMNYKKLQKLDINSKKLIRDSKTLSAKQRQAIIPILEEVVETFAISQSTEREIENFGIVTATFQAMKRAYEALKTDVDVLLIDGNQQNPMIRAHQEAIVGGDKICFAIAAASILAKEKRDAYMRTMALEYPFYDFQHNVGYGTKSHFTAIAKHGITPLHRRNFAPIRKYTDNIY